MELGGGVLDRTDDSNLTDSRGFSVGNPLKTRSISGGSFAASPAMRGRGGAPSPGRAMAMGEHQRGRSLSRQSSGRQMLSTSTPGRRSVGASASPGDSGRYSNSYDGYDGSGRGTSRTPGRTPSRGRQMYDHSTGTPHTWDERRSRAASTSASRSPRMASTRPKSTGRMRRPPRPLSLGPDPSGERAREREMDRDRRLRSMTPGRSSSTRSGHAAAPSSHILGNRRSKSDRAGYHPSHDWIGQEEREEEYAWPRWEDRHMMAAVGGVERGRGRQRSTHSKSMHGASERDSTGSTGRYDQERRGRSSSRGRSGTPTREQVQNTTLPTPRPARAYLPLAAA